MVPSISGATRLIRRAMFELNPVRAENFAASGPNWQGTNGDFLGVFWVTVQALDNKGVMAGRMQGRVISRYNRSPTNKEP